MDTTDTKRAATCLTCGSSSRVQIQSYEHPTYCPDPFHDDPPRLSVEASERGGVSDLERTIAALIRVREHSYPGDYYTEDFWEIANEALTELGVEGDPRIKRAK